MSFLNSEKLTAVENAEQAAEDIYNRNLHDICIHSGSAEDIVYIHKVINGQNRYMFINVSDKEIKACIDFRHTSDFIVYDVTADKK